MNLRYRLLYRLGITPWDSDRVPARLQEVAAERPPGRALDLGCGTGRDAVHLAGQGWDVTAIDGVPQALAAARRRGAEAGVAVTWVRGDVTRLEELELPGGYDLVLDRGCFHGLSDDERDRCAGGVTALAAPGAQALIFAFSPRRIGMGPRGVSAEDLAAHFGPQWVSRESVAETGLRLPFWLGDIAPYWHRLERRVST